MLTAVYQRFAGSCMMLMHRGSEEAYFSGTAFIVHKEGYLLTAAENVASSDVIVAVPVQPTSGFFPVTLEEVSPLSLELVRTDPEHGVALLRMAEDLDVGVPFHILGNPDRTELGTTVMALGFPYGHNRLHNLTARQGILSSKIETPGSTRLLLFDTLVQDGDRGGPLGDGHDPRRAKAPWPGGLKRPASSAATRQARCRRPSRGGLAAGRPWSEPWRGLQHKARGYSWGMVMVKSGCGSRVSSSAPWSWSTRPLMSCSPRL
jgi:serine protease Do